MDPNDDNQNPMGPTPTDAPAGSDPAPAEPGSAPAPQTDVPASTPGSSPAPTADEPAQPDLGAGSTTPPAGGAVEEKCATCGGPASAGNCTNCGQNQYGCTCQPASPDEGQGGPVQPPA